MMSKQKSVLTLFLVLGLLNSNSLFADELGAEYGLDTSTINTNLNTTPRIGEEGVRVKDFRPGLKGPSNNLFLTGGYKLGDNDLVVNPNYMLNQSSAAIPMSIAVSKPIINCEKNEGVNPCFNSDNFMFFVKTQIESIDIMNTVRCDNQYQLYDLSGQVLSLKSCERELACATGGESINNLSCVPDKMQLDRRVNDIRYNDIVAQAALTNLIFEPNVASIEMISRIAKEAWGLDTPKVCEESLDQKVNQCDNFELGLLANSFNSFASNVTSDLRNLTTTSEKERSVIANDKELNINGKKSADNVVGAIKRMRHLIYQDRVLSSSVVEEVKKFQADLLDIMKQAPKASANEIKVKLLKDYGETSNAVISYLMDKNVSNFEEVIKTFDRQVGRSKLKDYSSDNNPFVNILKKTIGEKLRNSCVNENQYSLKMSCEILKTANGNQAAKFQEYAHGSFFGRHSLKFLSEAERSVFLVKACENVERLGNCNYSLATFGSSREAARCAVEQANRNELIFRQDSEGQNDLSTEFRTSGLVDDLNFEGKSESTLAKLEVAENQKTDEDSNWTGHIADAFSGANGVMGASQFSQVGRNNLTDLSNQKKNDGNNEDAVVADSEKEKSRRADEVQRSQANNSAGFDSLRQELEALRTQMSIKQVSDNLRAQNGAQANTSQVVKDDSETEALKKKIADLESKLTSAPTKKVDRDYEDTGAWLRSPASNRNAGGVESKTQAQTNSRPSSDGANASGSTATSAASIPGANRNQAGSAAGSGGGSANSGLSLVRYENQSMVVLPQNTTTQDVEKKILELGGKPFFIENADGSFTQVITELDKDGKPALNNEGKPKFLIKKVASDKVTAVKSRGVASAKPQAKVRDLKEIDAATRKRELDELLKKTKK